MTNPLYGEPPVLNSTGRRIADGIAAIGAALAANSNVSNVKSLDETPFISNSIEAIGIPKYVDDVTEYADFGITETGWYVFARVTAKNSATVSADTTVEGAAGYIANIGDDHIDLAVKFDVAALSQLVTIDWGSYIEKLAFKASDLAVRNLDYRTTFYVYDAAPYTHFSFDRTTDTTFSADHPYFLKDENGNYVAATVTAGDAVPVYFEQHETFVQTTDTTFQDGVEYYTLVDGQYVLAEVTVGETVPEDTYFVKGIEYLRTEDETFVEGKEYYTYTDSTYVLATVTAGDPIVVYYAHSKVTFEGLARNITYALNEIIDCPMEFILPEIEDETHGCWFEIRLQHAGEYSMTLVPPEGVKIATEHTQKETAGINMIDLHYTCINGVKLWRFLNTHSSIPSDAAATTTDENA